MDPKVGFQYRNQSLTSWRIFIFSLLVMFSHVVFNIVSDVGGDQWTILVDSQWAKLIGFVRIRSGKFPSVIYFLALQLFVALVALAEFHSSGVCLPPRRGSCLGHLFSSIEHLGSHFRVVCCLFLPAVQLVAGISHPTWTSLPFFICSCIGLVDWSLTSNFLGLFRWSRYLLLYSGLNIVLLYVYQLPIEFSDIFVWIADFVGLYKISSKSEWSEISSCVSLLLFYFTLCSIRCDLSEMDFLMSTRESNLTEQLLPSKHSFFIHQSRSGVRHTNVLLRGAVFRTFSINFFIYGFPISLFALSSWSFHFASVCAFGLLGYVGYILFAFPPMFNLHRLNGLLLVFILLWAASTYIFNVAFTDLNRKREDTEIWETIGLWHYPIPGFYLLAQFFLGILVAMGNLVNNSVFLYLSDGDRQSTHDDCTIEEREEPKVLIVATVAWGLRKSSRAIVMALIFPIAMKPGFVHAAYMVYFMMYLLSHTISRRLRQSLILLCEVHFALLYILRLNLVSKLLEKEGSLVVKILSVLGLLDEANSEDYFKIVILACFCAIHNHGFDILFSFSAVVQHAPCPPVGFSILRAGLTKSVLLSVYTSKSRESRSTNSSHERRITLYLGTIGQKFLSAYRSCGTYIAFLTILLTVYLVTPNYTSFGYLFFLLFWMVGRQLVGKTRKRLWLPLKLYAVAVFILIYCLSVFFTFEKHLSTVVDLYTAFGFDPKAPILKNVWESLAVLIVMQLYSYERRQSKYFRSGDQAETTLGKFAFSKRLLILHSEKILFVALLYASLHPISAFGFLYLLGLVICSALSKTSRVPSKMFLIYSGFLLMVDYLFQMLGHLVEMFPGEKNSYMSRFLGLQVFAPGFQGLESGLRGKVLVIVACILRYNVFYWLGKMPGEFEGGGNMEEPCALFDPADKPTSEVSTHGSQAPIDASPLLGKHKEVRSNIWPFLNLNKSKGLDTMSSETGDTEGNNMHKYIYRYIWGSPTDSQKWNKKRFFALKKERLEMQKMTLKIHMKFWIENMFNIFGLEINMIGLLVASFAVLNAISLLYIASLAACILLQRHVIQKIWPIFVCSFASVLTLEYLAIWLHQMSWEQVPSQEKAHCHDCWRSAYLNFEHCKRCWLGITVDDPRMLISYYMVFMLACFKLRSDNLCNISWPHMYRQMLFQCKNATVQSDLSFETKGMWTFLDYLRLYSYCHLLDLVLALILITGTLEYDILHLGYLGFALVFFRIRLEILKTRNKIFRLLRMYNFALIVFSLAYQSPFVGDLDERKCQTIDYIFEVTGFYKYDYGFRITSRSALVEIIIFMLVSLQSYMFSSQEFDYVYKYLEAEQIGAIVCEQEKRAAWKTEQLQRIRKSEEQKCLRNLQVEKMKSEMLNLQSQLHSTSTVAACGNASPESENLRKRRNSLPNSYENSVPYKKENDFKKQAMGPDTINPSDSDMNESLMGVRKRTQMVAEKTSSDEEHKQDDKIYSIEHPLISAVHLIGDGVSQVQCLGNLAVNNIVTFLNIENEEANSNEHCSGDGVYNEIECVNMGSEPQEETLSMRSVSERAMSDAACLQISLIFRYIWAQIRSNNDVVCYCCFVLIFLWNFSLLSMVYLGALFLYALCVNTGPSYMFWIVILIYTEAYILLQYLYQIIIQHCKFRIHFSFLHELGFPPHKITSSFVISNWPLFLVYLFTLLQSSITARDGEWASLTLRRRHSSKEETIGSVSCRERIQRLLEPIKSMVKLLTRSLCKYWKSLKNGAETPPYFLQLSMEVKLWPEDGIQPERIESGINKILNIIYDMSCQEMNPNHLNSASRVRVQSIERSPESPNMALAVFEVVYAAPSNQSTPLEWYESLTPAADVANEIIKAQRAGIFRQIGFPFPILSVIGGGRKEVDLYAYMFGADLAVFFLVAIFYQSVIKNKSEFLEVYQLEDQFPKEFVFILMIIFFLIVLDRVIYLCSFATGKVIFYLFNLVLFTFSVTKYAWYMEPQHQRAGRFALRAIYLTKAISLALQAIQIRYGVPHKSTLYRQFLTSSVSQINFLGFRVYRALPFLYELRCVLDWSCTTTSLSMYDWLKLEDIYASLFLVKCNANLNRAKHRQGEKQTGMTKLCNGICLFFILICVIWAPMLMYSSGNPTNIANPIKDANVRIDVKTAGGRLTLFETTLCEKLSWDELNAHINLDPRGYLSSYNEQDIQLICCQADASTLWQLPFVVQARFTRTLEYSMDIIFSWQFTRDRPKSKEVVKYEVFVQDQDLPRQSDVMKVLNGTTNSFGIHNIYPRYFRVTGSGDVRFLEREVDLVSGDLVLNRGNPEWWSFHDYNASDMSACGEFGGPMAIVVSEETPQGILGETLSKFSIWGLYITFVLAVGRFIRLQCSDLRMRIPYENLPSCDRLLAICEDIYAARAEGELEVEEVLYWTLVKIYRSPHMLLEYTKPD